MLVNFGLEGQTCNITDVCQGYHQVGIQITKFGVNYTEYFDGNDTISGSLGIFYLSLNNFDVLDFDSWGGGVSFGFMNGTPGGGISGSIDIDIIGILRDLQDALKKGDK